MQSLEALSCAVGKRQEQAVKKGIQEWQMKLVDFQKSIPSPYNNTANSFVNAANSLVNWNADIRSAEREAMGIPKKLYIEDLFTGLGTGNWVFNDKAYDLTTSKTDLNWLVFNHSWRSKSQFRLAFLASPITRQQLIVSLEPEIKTVYHYQTEEILIEYLLRYKYTKQSMSQLIRGSEESVGFAITPKAIVQHKDVMRCIEVLQKAPLKLGVSILMENLEFPGQFLPVITMKDYVGIRTVSKRVVEQSFSRRCVSACRAVCDSTNFIEVLRPVFESIGCTQQAYAALVMSTTWQFSANMYFKLVGDTST